MNKLFFYLLVLMSFVSCGTKTIGPEKAIQLKGPIVVKIKIDKVDSVVSKNTYIKLSYSMPDSIVTKDGVVIKNIVDVDFGISPRIYQIDTLNNIAYHQVSPNFLKGYAGGKYMMGWELKKGIRYCEDFYVCKDLGVFWISVVNQTSIFRFWTADGKEYTILVTQDFDVPDRHTDMLVRYCPSIAAYLDVMQQDGFGHYCFKVVP